ERTAQNELEVLSGAWGRPAIGPSSAPVTIVEFSDFQCPFCSRAQPTLLELQKRYPSDVRIVFRHLPLDFHNQAFDAAVAAEAAHEQGRFDTYHRLLFENQKALSRKDLVEY